MEYEKFGSTLVLRPSGELDLVSAEELRRLVDDLLLRGRVQHLYVNLERVGFLDSSFIGALLGRYRRIAGAGGRMGLIRVPGAMRPFLEAAGLFRLMAEYESELQALTAG
jgi:stage II sporulation protein AA (anti-sigma F factor antagonist)